VGVDWKELTSQEASVLLFKLCVEVLLAEDKIGPIDIKIRQLTQRLHGDYRQLVNCPEYKRAVKHVHYFKNTGLGKELF
jgi:hypothetical protein